MFYDNGKKHMKVRFWATETETVILFNDPVPETTQLDLEKKSSRKKNQIVEKRNRNKKKQFP